MPRPYTRRMRVEGSSWRKTLAAAAVLGCVGEALDAVSIGWSALIFAGILAGGLAWLLRGGRGGVIVLGLMMLTAAVGELVTSRHRLRQA